MTSSQIDALTWLCSKLNAASIAYYTGVAPEGSDMPFVVITMIGGSSGYNLGGTSGMRIDDLLVSIGCHDNRREPEGVLTLEKSVATAIETQFNTTQGDSVIMSCDRKTCIGPLWLEHDNYWQMTTDWIVRVRSK